jgi:hypothetical protein
MFSHVLKPKPNFCVKNKFRKYIAESTNLSLQKKAISQWDLNTGAKVVPYKIVNGNGADDIPFYPPYFAMIFSISAFVYYFYHKK